MYITLSNGDGSSLTYDYIEQSLGTSIRTIDSILHPGGVLTYLAERGCDALMGRFFTRNP